MDEAYKVTQYPDNKVRQYPDIETWRGEVCLRWDDEDFLWVAGLPIGTIIECKPGWIVVASFVDGYPCYETKEEAKAALLAAAIREIQK